MKSEIFQSALLLLVAMPALAMGADRSSILGEIRQERRAITVPLESYAQLHAKIDVRGGVLSTSQEKKLFSSLVSALGMKSKTRDVSVGLRVKMAGTALPERSLMRYSLDSKGDKLTFQTSGNYTTPLVKIRQNQKIEVEIVFRDLASSSYQLSHVVTLAAELVPGRSLINEVSKPIVEKAFGLTDNALGAIGTQSTEVSYRDELSPFHDDVKEVLVPLFTRDGIGVADVLLSLRLTPSLTQGAVGAFQVAGMPSQRSVGEHYASLSTESGGVTYNLAGALRSLSDYSALLKDSSTDKVKAFCLASRNELQSRFGLTMADASYVMHGVLSDTSLGGLTSSRDWTAECFSESEQEVLFTYNRIVRPGPIVFSEDSIPPKVLDALGCWMKIEQGAECRNSEEAHARVIAAAFKGEINVQMDRAFGLSIGQEDMSKRLKGEDLLAMIKSSISTFSCYKSGMLLTGVDGSVFRLSGEYSSAGFQVLRVYNVSPERLSCKGVS